MALGAIRETIAQALEFANAMEHLSREQVSAFVGGVRDICIADMAMDSLARMELMIALETEHGVVITPDELPRFASLEAIAQHIADCKLRGRVLGTQQDSTLNGHENAADTEVVADCVRLYRRAFRSCRTVNQLNKLHIDMDNRLAPDEVLELSRHHAAGTLLGHNAPGEFIANTATWLNSVTDWMSASNKPAPERFERRWLAPAVLQFTGRPSPSGRTLLICFTTRGRRLMIPHAVLLQHLDASTHDVVIVADTRRKSFNTGVPLLGDSLSPVLRWLDANIDHSAYSEVRTLGTSGGGYAAVLAARRLPVTLGVSVGGRFRPGERLSRLFMVAAAWFASWGNRRARIILAFGDDKSRDRKFANWIARATGGERLAARIPNGEVGHLVLPAVLEHGALTEFLDQTLLAPAQRPVNDGRSRTVRFPGSAGDGALSD